MDKFGLVVFYERDKSTEREMVEGIYPSTDAGLCRLPR
jgi:hypothetical protein